MVVASPLVAKVGTSTEGLVQAMSQVSLKVGEIKGLKGDIEKLKEEMIAKDERMAQSLMSTLEESLVAQRFG
jgi:hypothetical protein